GVMLEEAVLYHPVGDEVFCWVEQLEELVPDAEFGSQAVASPGPTGWAGLPYEPVIAVGGVGADDELDSILGQVAGGVIVGSAEGTEMGHGSTIVVAVGSCGRNRIGGRAWPRGPSWTE